MSITVCMIKLAAPKFVSKRACNSKNYNCTELNLYNVKFGEAHAAGDVIDPMAQVKQTHHNNCCHKQHVWFMSRLNCQPDRQPNQKGRNRVHSVVKKLAQGP